VIKLGILAATAMLSCAIASGASAAYNIVIIGPDTASAPGGYFYDLLTPGPGHVGYVGGPDQTWGEGTPNIGGWLDFYTDGESLTTEAGSITLFLQASSPWYTLTPGAPPFTLTFTATPGHPEDLLLVNDGYGAPGNGNVDTLIVSVVPEPATWALMLVGVGGLGAALRWTRKTAPVAA